MDNLSTKRSSRLLKNREAQKRYRESLKGKQQQESYYKDTKVSKGAGRILNSIRMRCRQKNLPCTISIEHLEVPKTCPVLGIPLKQWGENTGLKMDSPTVDRLDPKGGYTPDNIRIISWRANKIKSDATVEELEAILAYVKGNLA